VTRSLADRLDPLPELPPGLAVTGTQQLLLAAVAFVLAALLLTVGTASLADRLGRSRSVNEMLHDE
jgi:chromate transport protein ChrA